MQQDIFIEKFNIEDNFEGEFLKELRIKAREEGIPVMLPETSKLLATIVAMTRPEKILEIGTAVGYSGSIMLKNAKNTSILKTIEIEESSYIRAKETFKKEGFVGQVTQYLGDAEEIIPMMSGTFDFILCDGPKSRYLEFYPYLKKMLNVGGTLFCDNVLFRDYISGEVKNPHRMQTIVNNMRDFLDVISKDEDMTTCLLDVGDGVTISVKKR